MLIDLAKLENNQKRELSALKLQQKKEKYEFLETFLNQSNEKEITSFWNGIERVFKMPKEEHKFKLFNLSKIKNLRLEQVHLFVCNAYETTKKAELVLYLLPYVKDNDTKKRLLGESIDIKSSNVDGFITDIFKNIDIKFIYQFLVEKTDYLKDTSSFDYEFYLINDELIGKIETIKNIDDF